MAKRRSATRKLPLERVFDRVTCVTSGTPVAGQLDLDLLQDEIAEIWHIDSTLHIFTGVAPIVDEVELFYGVLSMNPNISVALDPASEAEVLGDLETIFEHNWVREEKIIGSPSAEYEAGIKASDNKQMSFWPHPFLVGTNIGVLSAFTSTAEDDMLHDVAVYFTRRKATASELNQILLKRR